MLALLAVCAQAQAQANNAATGNISVAYASGTVPTEDVPITASASNIADDDGVPDPLSLSWQWSQSNDNGVTYDDITATAENGANTATFTPDQPQSNRLLQVCASFADNANNSEKLCHRIATRVVNVNDPPDNPMFTVGDHSDGPALTGAPVEDTSITLGSQGVNDADGFSDLNRTTYIWSADNGGDGVFTEISRRTLSFTPGQEHVGSVIRCCLTYRDDFNVRESFCIMTPEPVVNANDAPVAQRSSVAVRTDATSAEPYTFKPSDFRFADEDGDALANIRITGLPTGNSQGVGTLLLNGTALTSGNLPVTLTADELDDGDLTYYPTAGNAAVTTSNSLSAGFYAQFSFKVEDDGDDIRLDGNGEEIEANVSANIGSMNIRLADTSEQVPAGGAPAISPSGDSHRQHTVLTAAYTDDTNFIIFDRNGIDEGTVRWQWQQAAPVNDAVPAEASSAWTNITGATDAAFALTQAQVGMHTRVRITFADGLGNTEGPFYSASITTTDVADAPVAPGNTIPVAAGRSYAFSAADFPSSDEDGDALVHMRLRSLPDNGTLSLRRPATATASTLTSVPVVAFTREEFEQLGEEGGIELVYAPPAAATTPTANYDRFTYSVQTGTDAAPSNEAVITIALVSAMQSTATGAPTVTAVAGAAYAEDTELTASVDDISDDNGIDRRTLMWQWQSAAAPANGTAPAVRAYGAIAGATAAAFTPLQTHVGRYIRVCLTFTDGIGEREDPLCSDGERVANVNDAPMTEDSEVSVPTMTTEEMPYAFKASDFPFADEDTGDSLQGITITDAPDKGALLVGGEALLTSGSSKNNVVSVSDISMLAYYPAADAEAGRNYDSFEFTVSDGTESSVAASMSIHLGADLRLRLRIFLEGPLR